MLSTQQLEHLLILAIDTNDIELFKSLLPHVDVNYQHTDAMTILMCIAHKGRDEMMRLLFATGAKIDPKVCSNLRPSVDSDLRLNFSALFLAIDAGSLECCKILMENGSDVEQCAGSVKDITPLMRAAYKKHGGIVKYLLEMGADINKKRSVNGFKALDYANSEIKAIILNAENDEKFKNNVYEINDTTRLTTTGFFMKPIQNMSIIPLAGKYSVSFSGGSSEDAEYAIYVAGVEIKHTHRVMREVCSAVHTQCVATVDGTQAIEIKWCSSTATSTGVIIERSLIVQRI